MDEPRAIPGLAHLREAQIGGRGWEAVVLVEGLLCDREGVRGVELQEAALAELAVVEGLLQLLLKLDQLGRLPSFIGYV
jgi:hypothetical protein